MSEFHDSLGSYLSAYLGKSATKGYSVADLKALLLEVLAAERVDKKEVFNSEVEFQQGEVRVMGTTAAAQTTKDGEVKLTVKDCNVHRSKDTKQIVIPEGMSLKEAGIWIARRDQEEDKEVAVHHEIDCFPLDGAVAMRDSLDEIYGFVQSTATPTWFGEEPPVMIGVPISATETRQVPWGRVKIPGVSGFLNTSMVANPYPRFIINGKVKQRHLPEIQSIVDRTKERLKTHSVYKGKAIRLDLSWIRARKDFDPCGHAPAFTIPTETIVESDLIFPHAVNQDVRIGLFTPIECANKCRRHKIPLHRGVLLAGDYGTGKTLTAYVTAKKAVRHGFTFVYLSSVLDLALGFKFASQYAPAVIFAEDVDRVVSGERSEEMDAILNSFDGVDTKHGEVITVLTTNFLERLNQAILRPGRCDTLVKVTRPDADAAARLVQLYGRGLINESADFTKIGQALADHLPAEIREAVERAKLAAVYRLVSSGQMADDDNNSIQGHVLEDDVLAAVHAMEAQHKLLEPKDSDKRSAVEKAADILGNNIGEAAGSKMAQVSIALLQRLGHDQGDLAEAAQTVAVGHEGNGQG